MKTINLLKIMTCALLLSSEVGAQTIYDAAKFSGKDLNGTARFVGMGGAMGALGGDISTISTNPAGIGIYRSNDLMTTFGFNYTSSESNYKGNIMNSDKYRGSFDNIGFVYSSKIGNQTALRYVNFGFNYHKAKSFNRNFAMSGDMGGISQTDQMANMTDGASIDRLEDKDVFTNTEIGWLSALGWGKALLYSAGTDLYKGFPGSSPYGEYSSRERGGIDVYDFNVSFNINDRVYLGFTLGAYDLNYTKDTYYSESLYNNSTDYFYSLDSYTKTSGTGVDFKAGVIFRPLEDSPLKIGAAIHSPVFYNLTLYSSAIMGSDANRDEINNAPIPTTFKTVDTYDYVNGDAITDYQLRTPWKYNLSLGYIIGSNVALGAEYEYKDYSSSKLSYGDGVKMSDENGMIKDMLKGVNTIRLGAEIKLVPEFAIRAGYNYSSAVLANDAFKGLAYNSIRTDTDFANEKSINNLTLGLGYRTGNFYADIAYQYSAYKEDFYPFVKGFYGFNSQNEVLYKDEVLSNMDIVKTHVKNDKSSVSLTLGFRF
nr:TonB-dependent receptor [uncultured Bacteroides sp.]